MRTRYKKYSDYGIPSREVIETIEYLNGLEGQARKDVINVIADKLPPYIADYIAMALLENAGYNTMTRKYDLMMLKEDFYGWKRKGVVSVWEWRKAIEHTER